MVEVRAVDQVADVLASTVVNPRVLLLHDLLEWVGEVLRVYPGLLYHFVQGWVEPHDGVILRFRELRQLADRADVAPLLRIVLQVPCIIVLAVDGWLADQVGDRGRPWRLGPAVVALADGHVSCEELLDHLALAHGLLRRRCRSLNAIPSEVSQRTLVWRLRLESVEAGDLRIIG